jgi:hypothetical protein
MISDGNTATGYNQNDVDSSRHERGRMRDAIRRDPLRGFFVGLVLILAGIYGALTINGHLSETVNQVYWLFGMGAVFLIDEFARWLRLRAPIGSFRLFIGAGLVAIGALIAYGVDEWWPVIVIGMGVTFIVRSLLRK